MVALYELIDEAPYHLVRADPDASGPEVGKLLTWAAAPSGDAYQYQIHTRQGADSYVQRGTAPFGATATLAANLTPGATSLTITGLLDGDLAEDTDATGQAQGANLIRIDSEWLSWRTRTDNGGGTWTLNTLYRGVLDTVPALHAAATRVRFLSDAMGTTEDEYALTASVDAKYLPQTGQGTLPLASASNLPITLTQRVQRPYPPADVQINGASYPAAILGAYALSWKHRDRTQQLSVIGQPDASIGPETGTTYTLRLYGETDTLLRTETGLTGTGYTWTAEEADSGLGSGGDSNFPSVVALLHFDGADGSTTFTDVKGHTFTAAGNAQIDTSQSLSGGASGLFDGVGDYIWTPDSPDWDFGTGDLTVEIAVRFASLPSSGAVTLVGNYAGSSGWYLQYRNDGSNRLTFGVTGDSPQFDFAWTPSLNTWYRIAVSRVGTDLRAFIEGTQIGTTQTSSHDISGSTAELWLGALNFSGGIYHLNGWLDEWRPTKAGRYTVDYTPDAAPFADSAGDARLNGRIRCELESVRDGLASHQRHNITVDRAGWGYQWGNHWGGPAP